MNKYEYQLYKRLHVCPGCKAQDEFTKSGRTYCAQCAEKAREYYRKRLDKDPEFPKKNNAVHAAWKDRRKAQGLCLRCGEKSAEGHVYCEKCMEKLRESYRRRKKELPPSGGLDGNKDGKLVVDVLSIAQEREVVNE